MYHGVLIVSITFQGEKMATRNHARVGLLYGISDALSQIAPLPIVANRAPQTNDIAEIGTLWIYPATSAAYILVSVVNNVATWLLLESGGGAGVFASLLVTPGPSTLNGTVSLSTNAVASTVLVGTGAAAKTVTVGSTNTTSATTIQSGASGSISINSNNGGLTAVSGTGAINISNDAAATTLNVGTGAAAKTIVVGSTTAGSTVTINSATGSPVVIRNGIELLTPGATITLVNGTTISDGAGAPSSVQPVGSLYLNTTGSGINDRAYLSLGGGTWTAIVTVA